MVSVDRARQQNWTSLDAQGRPRIICSMKISRFHSQLSDLKEDHHTYTESCSMTIPIFAVAVIEMDAVATVAVVPSVLSPMCMKAGDPLLAQWWKGGSTALGAQVEGKTLRPLCQKHVADRRARPGARSGYCWVLLVGCPKIRARFCGEMSCLAEVCGDVTSWSLCLSFPWFWPVTCCHLAIWQFLPLILQQKSRQKTEVFKGRFLWVKAARFFPGS